MARYAPKDVLAAAERASSQEIKAWKRGVFIEQRSGRSIDEIHARAVIDRIQLASHLRRRGKNLMEAQPPQHRDAISRFYFSMYHAMRAVVAYANKGDDGLSHAKLPEQAPGDFPDRDLWINRLKDARERRNDADYSIYPKAESAWESSAEQMLHNAAQLNSECRAYLRQKGCAGI